LAFVGVGLGRSKNQQQTFLRARFLRRVATAKRALLAGGFLLADKPVRLAAGDEGGDEDEEEEGEGAVRATGDVVETKRPKAKLPSAALFKYGKPKAAAAFADEWAATAPPQAPKIPPLDVYAVRWRDPFLLKVPTPAPSRLFLRRRCAPTEPVNFLFCARAL
jgi:hypothetical protein